MTRPGPDATYISCCTLSQDCTSIALGLGDGSVHIWDLLNGEEVAQFSIEDAGAVQSIAYSHDSSMLVTGYVRHVVRILDARTGAPISRCLKHTYAAVNCAIFSPDGTRIASSVDDSVIIWSVQTQEQEATPLKSIGDLVGRITYSPDGSQIAGSSYNLILVWDTRTGELMSRMLGEVSLTSRIIYSPDGTQIMCGTNKEIRCFDAQTGQKVGKALFGHTGDIKSLAYSSDGSTIISGSEDRTIRIWDPKAAPSYNIRFGLNTDFNIDMTQDGWIYRKGERLLWVPEDCRNGLKSPTLLTIPEFGHFRRVRLDISEMCYGSSWTDILVGASVKR